MDIKLNNSDSIDLDTLISTRLLIQANSGGGKSWLIRRLLEQSHGKVQQIVIDLEGEFSSLREKYDYILAGKGGDTPAEPRSAALLARKLLELNVSAIVDLYELNAYDRKHFVKLFLEALVDAPKNLWHDVIVVVDEAHVFCPEKGQSEASSAVIELATRGRKRGFCAVLATQRLSKLHKDAAAECNNKLIGRTGLDIDRKRAAEELGFTSKDQELSLRTLKPGEFYAFGPAISNEVKQVDIGQVETSHYRAGNKIITSPTPPTEKIKALLGKLGDLPKEAEEEARTIQDLEQKVRELTLQIRRAPQSEAKIDQKQLDEIRRDAEKQVENHKIAFETVENGYKITIKNWKDYASNLLKVIKEIENIASISQQELIPPSEESGAKYIPTPIKIKQEPEIANGAIYKDGEFTGIRIPTRETSDEHKALPFGSKKILDFLASKYPMTFSRSQLARLNSYAPKGGSYNTYLSALRSKGFIEIEGETVRITEVGQAVSDVIPQPPTTPEENIEMWKKVLPDGPKKLLEAIVTEYPNSISKERLGEMVGMKWTGGSFNTYLSMLRSNNLVENVNGEVKLSHMLAL